jgi:Transposase
VLRVVHCGYRCPVAQCPGSKRLYRSMEADALALPGFTFGLDILLLVGQLRLREHQTVDEIHRTLTQRLALLGQTISRREMLFLFEAYTALLRAGTEVSQDAAWKEEVRENKGLLLSIDGIQLDNGNETIYLVRDVLTGRMLTAENVTDSTKERLKQVLAPVVALDLPVLGVISDAQPTELQAVAELWPQAPHKICQFHAIREAGRLIYNADHRVKTDMRIRLQQKTHEYRQNIHKRLKDAEEKKQEIEHLHILEEYAARVEGALNIDSLTPFQYGGLAMQEALTKIQTSLEKLEKGGSSDLHKQETPSASQNHREFA